MNEEMTASKKHLAVLGVVVILLAFLAAAMLRPHADTAETLLPNPAGRTRFWMLQLEEDLVRYQRRVGVFPYALDSLRSAPAEKRTDIWRRGLRYVRTDTSYELRSAGADGRWDTADDILLTGRASKNPEAGTAKQ